MGKVKDWIAQQCVVRVGSNRIILDLVKIGFVIKLPLAHGVLFYVTIKAFIDGTSIISFPEWVAYPMDNNGFWGLKRTLFKGIADNWREFRFSVASGHPFVQPTYFSLLGLVNVQRRGDPPKMESGEFLGQLQRLAGEECFYSDPHHFKNVDNFCWDGSFLRMTDYGSSQTRLVILKRGMCVYNNFRCDEPM